MATSTREKARAKAAEALKEVQKSPARFAELAKQYSQDPRLGRKGRGSGLFCSRHDGEGVR
ncbi:MAG: peptidylprolyl isomerase [Candidatus Accumulibacter propinquus]